MVRSTDAAQGSRRSASATGGLVAVLALSLLPARSCPAAGAPVLDSSVPKLLYAEEREFESSMGEFEVKLLGQDLWNPGPKTRAYVRGTRGAGCFEEIAVDRWLASAVAVRLPYRWISWPDRLDFKVVVADAESNAFAVQVVPRPKSIEWRAPIAPVRARDADDGWAPESQDDVRVAARGLTNSTTLVVVEGGLIGRSGEVIYPWPSIVKDALKLGFRNASVPMPWDDLAYFYPTRANRDLPPGHYRVALVDRDVHSDVVPLHIFGRPEIRAVSPSLVSLLPKAREKGAAVTLDYVTVGDAPGVVHTFFARKSTALAGSGDSLPGSRRPDGRTQILLPPALLADPGGVVIGVRNRRGAATIVVEIEFAERAALESPARPDSPTQPMGSPNDPRAR